MRQVPVRLIALSAALIFCLIGTMEAEAAAVGSVTRLRGDANALTAGQSRILAQDAEIDLGDRLQTGPNARLEVKFLDGTMLTLGEKADFTIDALTYTPKEGTALFTRLDGAIRLIGGEIAKIPGHKIEVAGNAGTIGIRGTDVWGGTVKPGSLLDVFLIEGSVEVRTAAGTVVLGQPGTGTSVTAAGGAPAEPATWARPLINQAFATVSFDAP